jgi:hypothetical protein
MFVTLLTETRIDRKRKYYRGLPVSTVYPRVEAGSNTTVALRVVRGDEKRT